MGQQAGCCTGDKGDQHEQIEPTIKKNQDANIPSVELATPAAAAPPAGKSKEGEAGANEYVITLNKTEDTRLGIDVDHQDGVSLLIDAVTGGLMQKWNDENPDTQVKAGDRVIEVNGVRDDVLQLVDQCKKNQALKMVLRRGSPA